MCGFSRYSVFVRISTVLATVMICTIGRAGFAQELTLSSAATLADNSATLSLTFASGTSPVAALQWSFTYPSSNIATLTATAGPALVAAGKTITCLGAAGSYTCIAAGLNSTTIGAGVLAQVSVKLAGIVDTTIGMANTLATSADGSLMAITGTGGTVIATIPPLGISSISCTTTTLGPLSSTPCTISLNAAAGASGATIAVSSSSTNVTVPANLTVAAGATTAAFTAAVGSFTTDQTSIITASLNGAPKTVTLSLAANASITSLQCTAATLGPNGSTNCSVGLSKAAPASGAPVSLVSSVSSITVPPTVIVPAGATTAAFTAAAGSFTADQPAVLTASLNGTSKTASLSLVSLLAPDSLQCTSTTLQANGSTTCTVHISGPAPAGGISVLLSSSSNVVSVPASVLVAANSSTATFVAANSSSSTGSQSTSVQAAVVSASLNGSARSVTLNIAAPSSGAASFVKTDTTTAGTWKSVYGSDGYSIIGDTDNYPSYVSATATGNAPYTWAFSSGDFRALQKPSSSTDRIASCWYSSTSFSIDLNFKDSATHQVAFYLLDWDGYGGGRGERVDILDSNNNVLDSRTASTFLGGQYLVWNLSGHVTVRITNTKTSNAVLSGLFFGAGPAPSSTVTFVKTDNTTAGNWKSVYGTEGYNVVGDTASYPSYVSVTPAGNALWAWAASTTDARGLQKAASTTDRIANCWYSSSSFTIDMNFKDGKTHQVAMYMVDWDTYAGGRSQIVEVLDPTNKVLDSRTVTAFTGGRYLVWNLGGHVIFRFNNTGSNAVVSGLFFGAGSSTASGTASFLKTDNTTVGTWKSVYGTEGYNVIGNTASYPSYVSVTPAGNALWAWAASTADVRGLQKAASTTDRIANCWYSTTSFTVDMNFTDGKTHQVAMYLLDWDSYAGGRSETVEVLDASNKVLDSRIVTGFSGGRYLVWNLSGHVTFRFSNTATYPNAVLSGIFFR